MPRKQELIIRAPDPKADHDELLDLVAKVFSAGMGYYGFRDHCRNGYMDRGGMYDWAASRIGMMDGRIVTHFGVWRYQTRIGSCTLPTAGIGVVATDADYRKRGLMDQTMQPCLADMPSHGFDLTVLFGIWDFYHRFGYVQAWPGQAYSLRLASLPKGLAAVRVRPWDGKPRRDLDALYNRQFARLTGLAVRPTYACVTNPELKGYVWAGGSGKPQGFVLAKCKDGTAECVDHAGQPEKVVSVLADLARQWGCNELKFPALHYESELARWLRAHKCRLEYCYIDSGDAMAHVTNLRGCLSRIAPELSKRLAASAMCDWRGELLVADERQRVLLRLDGQVTVVPGMRASRHGIVAGHNVARLVLGNGEGLETARATGMKLTGDAANLVGVLFPEQHPMLPVWDRY